LLPYASMINDI